MKRKLVRRALWTLLILFLLANIIAFMHAYTFTHFTDASIERTSNHLSWSEKLKLVFTGVNNPRPVNKKRPNRPFETINIRSNKELKCWLVKADNAKGTIIIFHGYGADKSLMLDKAEQFLNLGYSTLLVDFIF